MIKSKRNLIDVLLTVSITLLCILIFTGCNIINSAQKQKEEFAIEKVQNMIDLHIHLDGSISVESAKQLAQMQNIPIPQSDEELTSKLRVPDSCHDLNEFLEKFDFPCSLIQTKEGLTCAVKNLLNELEKENVVYTEIRFAPQKSCDKGLTQEQAVEAAIEGAKDSPVKCKFILCCMRGNDTHSQNLETIDVAAKYIDKGVCAIDLAGAEAIFPTKEYDYMFNYAKSKDVPYTIHVGEADGTSSIKAGIALGCSRIGHGVMASFDDDLMNELAEKQIPLELCPTSNINTAVFKDYSEYPLRKFLDSGVYVTINTDDPSISGTSIKKEYKTLIDTFHLNKDDVKKLLLNSARAAFIEDKEKNELINAINAEFDNYL